MSNVSLSSKMFEFNNLDYYRTGSLHIGLGHYGSKRGRLGGGFIEPESRLTVEDDDIKEGMINLKTENVRGSEAEISAAFDIGAAVDIEGSVARTSQKLHGGELVLISMQIDEKDLKEIINEDEYALRFFRAVSRPRVVSRIWYVVTANLVEDIEKSTSFSIKAPIGGANLNLSYTRSTGIRNDVTLSEGSTFGYMLSRETRASRKNALVTDIELDQFGIGK